MSHFTVVIPTYNRAQLVHRAIESAINQTAKADQIVVVDDGSTDDTAGVCGKYADSIEYVRQPNAGVSAARNHGIKRARHPWTAFLDSDDYWLPTHLEKIAGAIEGTSGRAAFYFTDLQFSDGAGGGTLWTKIGLQFSEPFILAPDGTRWLLTRQQPCAIQTTVMSTPKLRAAGGFDPTFRVMEETDLYYRLGVGSPICAVNGIGGIQTSDDSQDNRLTGIVNSRSEDYWKHAYRLSSNVLARFPNLKRRHRQALRFDMACASWMLARVHWRSGGFASGCRALFQSLRIYPPFLLSVICRNQSPGWERNVFSTQATS